MRIGADRTDVAPIWPTRLVRPDTRIIYLDLNHWIALAKANAGHPDGRRWLEALHALREERSGWSYVISMALIMELTGNRRRLQRADLAEMIEEFTGFGCVMPLTTIAPLEFESALSQFVEITLQQPSVPLMGHGVMQAVGMRGHLRVRDRAGNDVTDLARQESPLGPQEFDRRLRTGELLLDRSVIGGPADDQEEAELRAIGWDPAVAHQSAEQRAEQERDLAAQLDSESRWRRGRLRDVVASRYLALEIEETRDRILMGHSLRLADVLTDIERARAFSDSMPAADVWITLRTVKHRNRDSKWTANDIFDIDALSVAAAYCDVVVTERHAAHVLDAAGVPNRLGTTVLTDLDQLVAHLEISD
jgi:hypothetical protein